LKLPEKSATFLPHIYGTLITHTESQAPISCNQGRLMDFKERVVSKKTDGLNILQLVNNNNNNNNNNSSFIAAFQRFGPRLNAPLAHMESLTKVGVESSNKYVNFMNSFYHKNVFIQR
jgi:hypothetical protein